MNRYRIVTGEGIELFGVYCELKDGVRDIIRDIFVEMYGLTTRKASEYAFCVFVEEVL